MDALSMDSKEALSNAPSATPGPEGALAVPNDALGLLRDVEVDVTIEIGRRRMKIADVLRLKVGQTLELSKAAGQPLDVYVNGQLLGRGEAVVVGERYGIRITDFANRPIGGDR